MLSNLFILFSCSFDFTFHYLHHCHYELGALNPPQQEIFHIQYIDTFIYKPRNSSYTCIPWYYNLFCIYKGSF